MPVSHEVRYWGPKDSPGLFLGFLGQTVKKLPRKEAAEQLRQALCPLTDAELEWLAQQITNHRRESGEDPQKTFTDCLDHLRREREAGLHPQPHQELA